LNFGGKSGKPEVAPAKWRWPKVAPPAKWRWPKVALAEGGAGSAGQRWRWPKVAQRRVRSCGGAGDCARTRQRVDTTVHHRIHHRSPIIVHPCFCSPALQISKSMILMKDPGRAGRGMCT